MTFILRYLYVPKDGIGQYSKTPDGTWYFVRAGTQWPYEPSKRMIDATTQRIEEARKFDTEEDARAQLAVCGMPPGWEVVEYKDA